MSYRKKVTALSITAGALALLYAALILFSPDRVAARSTRYSWLDPKLLSQAARIEISDGAETVALAKENGAWFVEREDGLFPAKGERAEDLLKLLSTQGSFPVRAGGGSARDRLGLGDDAPRRIAVRRAGVESSPLVEIAVGDYDAAGQEVYYRRVGSDEVRSGTPELSRFSGSGANSWYDLRLFPEEIPVDEVRKITVAPPGGDLPLIVSAAQGLWQVAGLEPERTDTAKVRTWIRGILSAGGEDWVPEDGDTFSRGRIIIETEKEKLYIRVGEEIPSGEEDQTPGRRAKISPGDATVKLSSWTLERLFRDAASFTLSEPREGE